MAKYHQIDVETWEDLLEFESAGAKALYIFLFSNAFCRPSGLYKIKLKTMFSYTSATLEDLKALCGKLIEYDFETNEVFVRGKMKRVFSGLKNNVKMKLSILSDYKGLRSPFLSRSFYNKYEGAWKGLGSPPIPLPMYLGLKEVEEHEEEKQKPINEPRHEILDADFEFDRTTAFKQLWEKYPAEGRLNETFCLHAFFEIIVNRDLFARIQKALEKYKRHLAGQTWGKHPKNMINWLAEWPDWEKHEEPVSTPKKRLPRQNCEVCQGSGYLPDQPNIRCFCWDYYPEPKPQKITVSKPEMQTENST